MLPSVTLTLTKNVYEHTNKAPSIVYGKSIKLRLKISESNISRYFKI